MNYVLLINEGEQGMASLRDPAKRGPYMGAWKAYAQRLAEAGLLAGGTALQLPDTAITLRFKDGNPLVQDGPFAETKEQLGGFFIIDVPSRDVALDWAARCPIAPGGAIEIRPAVHPAEEA
jgi:hypothetical protein